jgi:hypothetical protein
MDVPYDPDTRLTLYRVDTFRVDGGARDDVALVAYDLSDGDEPFARWIFSESAACGELDPELDTVSVADWLRDVVDAHFTEGRDVCDDCGNPYNGARPHGGHSADCDYADS